MIKAKKDPVESLIESKFLINGIESRIESRVEPSIPKAIDSNLKIRKLSNRTFNLQEQPDHNLIPRII